MIVKVEDALQAFVPRAPDFLFRFVAVYLLSTSMTNTSPSPSGAGRCSKHSAVNRPKPIVNETVIMVEWGIARVDDLIEARAGICDIVPVAIDPRRHGPLEIRVGHVRRREKIRDVTPKTDKALGIREPLFLQSRMEEHVADRRDDEAISRLTGGDKTNGTIGAAKAIGLAPQIGG